MAAAAERPSHGRFCGGDWVGAKIFLASSVQRTTDMAKKRVAPLNAQPETLVSNGRRVSKYRVERLHPSGKREFFGVGFWSSEQDAIAQVRRSYGPKADRWTFEAREVI